MLYSLFGRNGHYVIHKKTAICWWDEWGIYNRWWREMIGLGGLFA